MDGEGIGISTRRITLSTSGVVPMMARAGAELGVNLAISLHAVTDEVRSRIMPINKKYPLQELMAACRDYPGASNARRITFEYVMLKGVNDSLADARELLRLVKGLPAKFNLIPFNPWPGSEFRMFVDEGHPRLFRSSGPRLFGADPKSAVPTSWPCGQFCVRKASGRMLAP